MIDSLTQEGLYPIHVVTLRENPKERHDLIESLIERGAKVSQITQEVGHSRMEGQKEMEGWMDG